MNKVMFEVMRYFGLNHKPSSGVKWKLIELGVTFTLESQILSLSKSRLLFMRLKASLAKLQIFL